MICSSIHNIINIFRLHAKSSDVNPITTFHLPINDTSCFYLQSQSLHSVSVIDKPFLRFDNVFENLFTWKELTDNMSEAYKFMTLRGRWQGKTFLLFLFLFKEWNKKVLKRVEVIINMPKASRVSRSSIKCSQRCLIFLYFVSLLATRASLCAGKLEQQNFVVSHRNEWLFRCFGILLIRFYLHLYFVSDTIVNLWGVGVTKGYSGLYANSIEWMNEGSKGKVSCHMSTRKERREIVRKASQSFRDLLINYS